MTPDEIDAKLVKTNLTEELLMLPLQSRVLDEQDETVPKRLKGMLLFPDGIVTDTLSQKLLNAEKLLSDGDVTIQLELFAFHPAIMRDAGRKEGKEDAHQGVDHRGEEEQKVDLSENCLNDEVETLVVVDQKEYTELNNTECRHYNILDTRNKDFERRSARL